jgi:hypothetical protein
MTNIFTEVAVRLEKIQQKLLANKEANEHLQISFRNRLQENFNYLRYKYPQFYSSLISHQINYHKVVCFENGEANILNLKNGTLLYGESPISETKKQIQRWLDGNNVLIKVNEAPSKNSIQNDDVCQLHYYTEYSIEKEIEEFIHQHQDTPKLGTHEIIQELPMLVINGGGLGYPILELCSHIEPKFIFYIEPDLEIFLCSLGVIDWIQLLDFLDSNNQTIIFIIGQNGNESYSNYSKYIFQQYPFLQSYQLYFTHYSSPDTETFLTQIKANTTIGFKSNGMFDDSIFGLNNIILNSQKYKYLIKEEYNRFNHLPIAIIANGPSLDDDLKFLTAHQNNFITVACGTAITALEHVGIIPDFYVAVERIDEVYKSLLYVKNQEIFRRTINISVDVVHPLTMNMFSNNIIVSKPGEQLQYYFKDLPSTAAKFNDLIICEHTNPLVANCAISIFLNLLFQNYYLFGVDNGSVNLSKHHSENSYYYEHKTNQQCNILNIMDSDEPVNGNFTNKIYTNRLFNLCRKHIELEIEKHPHAHIYNCSNGAFIRGTTPIHSYELNISNDLTNLKREYNNYLQEEKSKTVTLTQSDINYLYDTNKFNQIVEQIISIWQTQRQSHTRLSIIRKMNDTTAILSKKHLNFFRTILNGSLCVYFSLIIYSLYIYKSDKLSLQLADKCIDHLIDFLNMSKDEFKNANHLIQGKHFKYLPPQVYENWKANKEEKN